MACLVGYLVRRMCKATRHGMPEITTCSVRKICKATRRVTWLRECARQLGMAYPKSPPARVGECIRQLGMACPKSPPALAIHGCHSKLPFRSTICMQQTKAFYPLSPSSPALYIACGRNIMLTQSKDNACMHSYHWW
jgi:hypothetical protein